MTIYCYLIFCKVHFLWHQICLFCHFPYLHGTSMPGVKMNLMRVSSGWKSYICSWAFFYLTDWLTCVLLVILCNIFHSLISYGGGGFRKAWHKAVYAPTNIKVSINRGEFICLISYPPPSNLQPFLLSLLFFLSC